MKRRLALLALLTACSSSDGNDNNPAVDMGADFLLEDLGVDASVDMVAVDVGSDLPDGPTWDDLTDVLSPPVEDGTLPSLTAVVFEGGEIIAAGAVGVRKLGSPTEVTLADKHYLASVSKPFTATLAARLVDTGVIEWTTTVDILGFDDLDPGFVGVTLLDLLTHQAGLTENDVVIDDAESIGPRASRVRAARLLLTKPPKYTVGVFSYSNASLVLAAAMLEAAADADWEVLMEREVFEPLSLDSCGFGWPAGAEFEEQPVPHQLLGGVPSPVPSSANWDSTARHMFPAGGIHCSLPDVMRFGRVHASRDASYLNAETLAFLTTTKIDLNYQTRHGAGWHTGAWMTVDEETFFHNGAYTDSNMTHLHLNPGNARGVVISTNIHSTAADRATTLIFRQLEAEYF